MAQLDGDGVVRNFGFAVCENVVQPLDLGGLPRHNHVVVALPVVGLQVGGDQVEVFVETRLRDHVPVDDHPIRKRGAPVELHDMEGFEQAFQPFGCDEQGLWRGEFDRIRNAFKGALRALHGLFQLAFGAFGIGHPNARIGRDEVEQRLDGFVEALVADVGHHHRPGHLVDTELGDGVKLSDGVHFVAEELDAVGMIKRVGKHVYNAATHRVLPGFVNKINLAETVFDEHLVKEVHGVLLTQGQGEGLFGELALADDLLGNGFPEGDNGEPLAVAVDFIEDLSAHRDVGVFCDLFLVRNPRRTREKQHVVGVANQLLQVIEEVSGRFLVV